MTSLTLRGGRNVDGGDTAAWLACDDGSVDLTKLSELPVPSDSIDCWPYDELMDARGFGGGGVGDFRMAGDDGRGDGGRGDGAFGDTGRTIGSAFEVDAADGTETGAEVAVDGCPGVEIFNGGGGIIPLP